MCIIRKCKFETFYEDRTNRLSTGIHKKENSNILRLTDGISYWCILMYLDCTKYDEINIPFRYAHKDITNKILHE